jgi:lipopolysaccharide biosynthesis glycosyltransferase
MVVVDRIELLWQTDLGKHVIASPEFCEFKFSRYFTEYFWQNKTLSGKYETKRDACYFNPGVMLFDTAKWRQHDITSKLLRWMNVQKEGAERIYRLGSLPPFLLVFSGNLKAVEREWNIHDLGCGCQVHVDPRKAKLLHWSCDGKPWRRLEVRRLLQMFPEGIHMFPEGLHVFPEGLEMFLEGLEMSPEQLLMIYEGL